MNNTYRQFSVSTYSSIIRKTLCWLCPRLLLRRSWKKRISILARILILVIIITMTTVLPRLGTPLRIRWITYYTSYSPSVNIPPTDAHMLGRGPTNWVYSPVQEVRWTTNFKFWILGQYIIRVLSPQESWGRTEPTSPHQSILNYPTR